MASPQLDIGSSPEAELAVKSNIVEALTAENEQLRRLLQRQADQAEASDIKRFSRGDMRRESNINELQAALACMRSQLHETAADYEEQKKLVSELHGEKESLLSKLSDAKEQIEMLKKTITELETKLAEGQASLEDERLRIATLRNGLDESKRAIIILQEQNERRQSEAAAARRASLEAQGILQPISATGAAQSATSGSRRASLAFPNVSEARRGSLNYLNGLGLATKRTAYFDPSKMGLTRHGSLADNSTLPSEQEVLARRRASLPASGLLELLRSGEEEQGSSPARSGMPTSASSPHLTGTVSRKGSLAARRSSIGYENSPTRRNSHLAHTLSKLAANGSENDLPMSRRGSRILANAASGLSSLPEHGITSVDPAKARRRSSLLVNTNQIRRPSDKPIPTFTREDADDPLAKVRKIEDPSSLSGQDNNNAVVHALSLEAVMEISALRETVEQLRNQLFESEEAREASETCAKVLREFIGSQVDTAIPTPAIRLPPLPTEADEFDTASPNAKIKTDKSAAESKKKTSSLWAIPKILPALSYSTSEKDSNLPPTPTDSIAKTFNSISTDLLLPSRIADIKRRSSSISSKSEYSCNSGPASPYLGFSNQSSFKPNFESFSFSAHRGQAEPPRLEPPSPLVGPTDTARFPDSASSTADSESEAEPVTPSDAEFSENVINTPKMQEQDQQVFGSDAMLLDKAANLVVV